jgi:hypothetical protein
MWAMSSGCLKRHSSVASVLLLRNRLGCDVTYRRQALKSDLAHASYPRITNDDRALVQYASLCQGARQSLGLVPRGMAKGIVILINVPLSFPSWRYIVPP